MCLCNIDSPAEFMNTISNEDDKATPEGMAALDADLEKMHAENRERMIAALKLAMFDKLVDALATWLPVHKRQGFPNRQKEPSLELVAAEELLFSARRIQKGELP